MALQLVAKNTHTNNVVVLHLLGAVNINMYKSYMLACIFYSRFILYNIIPSSAIIARLNFLLEQKYILYKTTAVDPSK